MGEDGKVTGIRSGDVTATAPLVICDPSYTMGPDGKSGQSAHCKPVGKVIRAICLLNHTIPHTHDAQSIQLILPAKQIGKQTGKCYSKNNVFPSKIFNQLLTNFIYFNRYLYFYGQFQSLDLCKWILRCNHICYCRD